MPVEGTKYSPISTSPLAAVALKAIQLLDPLVGPSEAQMFMLRSNEYLDGITPVDAIKAKRSDDVMAAVRAVAMEKGLFEEPFLPPNHRK
jgi:hypothetical protein